MRVARATSLPFFTRAAGIVQSEPLSSSRDIPASSVLRAAVSSSSRELPWTVLVFDLVQHPNDVAALDILYRHVANHGEDEALQEDTASFGRPYLRSLARKVVVGQRPERRDPQLLGEWIAAEINVASNSFARLRATSRSSRAAEPITMRRDRREPLTRNWMM